MKRNPEIEDLVGRIYDGMRRGDLGTITGTISRADGLIWIGTDPQEFWTGYDTMAEVFRAQLEVLGTFDLVNSDPQGYGDGDIAWVADQPALRLPDGTELPLRVTAVAEREGDAWRFVQWHVSVGVGNEEAFGEELPT